MTITSTEDLQARFDLLSAQWKKETAMYSSLNQMMDNDAYKAILAMGIPAITFILRDLEKEGNHWFHALVTLTCQDVARGEETVEGARQKWLAWGRDEKFI